MSAAGAALVVGVVVTLPAGVYAPFYPASDEEREVPVEAFRLDATPVTNAAFLDFVRSHPEWERGRVPSLLADSRYLVHWAGPLVLGGDAAPDSPVTDVSWHAARAYCRARGGELPTVAQWERAADATPTRATGARSDPATLDRILAWYARGGGTRPGAVGGSTPTVHGVYDLHGLVWEWTLDFNSLLVASDAREGGEGDELRFCGAGALSAADPSDYATFMRYAFRSSLTASSTTGDLGFRCAYAAR